MTIPFTEVKVIEERDWSDTVSKVYNRPYRFQQQNGCYDRGIEFLEVPSEHNDGDMADNLEPGDRGEMGVKFATWVAGPVPPEFYQTPWSCNPWWVRNFYPDLQIVANDLHAKGLLPAGTYGIHIDW